MPGMGGVGGYARLPALPARDGWPCRRCGAEVAIPGGARYTQGKGRPMSSTVASAICTNCFTDVTPQAVPGARAAIRAPLSRRARRQAKRVRPVNSRPITEVIRRQADRARSIAAEKARRLAGEVAA